MLQSSEEAEMQRSKKLLSIMTGAALGVVSLPSHALLLVEMDNADTVATVSGGWIISTKNLLYYGDNYFAAQGVGGAQTRTVTYRSPNGYENDGTHCFYASWSDGPGRPTNARYRIDYEGDGTFDTSVTVDQTKNGGEWRRLTCSSAGSPGERPIVEVSNFGVAADKWVVADGIRITREDVDRTGIVDEPGIDWVDAGSCNNIPTTVRNCASVQLTAPSSGYVMVQCKAYAVTFGEDTTVILGVSTSSASLGESTRAGVLDGTDTKRREFPMSTFAVFSASPGTRTYYCNAQKPSVFSARTVNLGDVYMTATFFPSRY
jgi:hypothetical protein